MSSWGRLQGGEECRAKHDPPFRVPPPPHPTLRSLPRPRVQEAAKEVEEEEDEGEEEVEEEEEGGDDEEEEDDEDDE